MSPSLTLLTMLAQLPSCNSLLGKCNHWTQRKWSTEGVQHNAFTAGNDRVGHQLQQAKRGTECTPVVVAYTATRIAALCYLACMGLHVAGVGLASVATSTACAGCSTKRSCTRTCQVPRATTSISCARSGQCQNIQQTKWKLVRCSPVIVADTAQRIRALCDLACIGLQVAAVSLANVTTNAA